MVHKKYSPRQILLAAAACFLIMGVLTFYLWHLTENVRLGYAITKSMEAIGKLEKDIKVLRTQREAILAPGQIEITARERLGLQELREDQIVRDEIR